MKILNRCLKHLFLIVSAGLILLPLWMVISVAGTQNTDVIGSTAPLYPNVSLLIQHLNEVLFKGVLGLPPYIDLLWRSFVMAASIAVGKILLSLCSAYAIVYFRLPFKRFFFVVIFLTLMLPIEVRMLPSYQIIVDFNMLNSYTGLILPVIASATATLFFKQFFETIPVELLEAARLDNAGYFRFMFKIVLPLSKTNIAAIFLIMFVYGWNQYLWPLMITSKPSFYTITMSLSQISTSLDSQPLWWQAMAGTLVSTIPVVVLMISMQKFFVKGLIQTEK
ncbi:ABC transporter permease subunit [Vibrio marisflavi]|uniref:sn-glycerol-3-phosphate transport system permease protein UgpE n=1 Tax=Vibrio marisflavi CECT 7928 TaxID=634439 RepID=A0ABN8E784_9VIBR|nr:ABC transporter permease subunit [Vibrio marisflavi]CAH0538963.1 Lactose transport system permease protein LacG [Vibrio marisflavi CECT 7928]